MPIGAITGHIDVALVALYAFWAFFFLLIYWLRREDQREGYLLETNKGDLLDVLVPPVPPAKTYRLADGTTKIAPDGIADTRPLNLQKLEPWEGSPADPTGNPMLDGVGPAAYAMRQDKPEADHEGRPKIVPLRAAPGYEIAAEDPDPRGLEVHAREGAVVGRIVDAWVDRAEALIRYYEIELAGTDPVQTVLAPANFVNLNVWRGQATVSVITKAQFADVPKLKKPDVVTKLEEDMIGGYYAGADVYGGAVRRVASSW